MNQDIIQQQAGMIDQRMLTIPTDDPQAALQFCQKLALSFGLPVMPPHTTPPPQLSVVIPVYNEQENLPELYRRLVAVLEADGAPFELLFVNDGSKDQSLALMHQLVANDSRVVVIDLARNFGHQTAITAGLEHARGAGVIVIDADLQDPPEVLPLFIAEWRNGSDVVYAIRTQRKEFIVKRWAYSLFYRLLRKVAAVDIPLDAGDFCIMDRRVVEILNRMPERNRFVRGIRSWVGFHQVGLAYERQARYAGKPKYTLRRLIYLALDGLISFSFLPLRVITGMGFIVSLLSLGLAVMYTIQRIFFGLTPPGFPTLVVALFFLSGVQLITIGVIGEYVGRIFDEVKRRPLYTIRQVAGGHAYGPVTNAKFQDRRF